MFRLVNLEPFGQIPFPFLLIKTNSECVWNAGRAHSGLVGKGGCWARGRDVCIQKGPDQNPVSLVVGHSPSLLHFTPHTCGFFDGGIGGRITLYLKRFYCRISAKLTQILQIRGNGCGHCELNEKSGILRIRRSCCICYYSGTAARPSRGMGETKTH